MNNLSKQFDELIAKHLGVNVNEIASIQFNEYCEPIIPPKLQKIIDKKMNENKHQNEDKKVCGFFDIKS